MDSTRRHVSSATGGGREICRNDRGRDAPQRGGNPKPRHEAEDHAGQSAKDWAEGEGEMTTRLQKFIEIGSSSEGPGRAAYVLDVSALPRPAKGMEWQKIDSFSAAEEVLNDPGLKTVFKTAIENGFAVVEVKADEK
jgi:hypothetical protein